MFLHCTADRNDETGGGLAVRNEVMAMEELGETVRLDASKLSPELFGQLPSVFLPDYFAYNLAPKGIVLAHFYSGTFTLTVEKLKQAGALVCYHVPAHDRKTTVEEFTRLGLEYPWHHIADDSLWAIFSRGYHLADVCIAQSQASARFLKSEGIRDVRVIHGGCYLPEAIKPLPNKFTIGYLGQVGPDKGLAYLIRAWAKLNYKDAELLLAGEGTKELGPLIQRYAGQGNFALCGRVRKAEDLYNAVSVYVQPSVCEAFGLEVVEAMAHGRPVIVSEGAGASELVTDGVEGFVVPIRSPDALAEKIDWCWRNKSKLAEMGKKGREVAEVNTWEIIREEYKRLWRGMLENKT